MNAALMMQDVARASGYSRAAVSMALRGDRSIPEATRNRIRAVEPSTGSGGMPRQHPARATSSMRDPAPNVIRLEQNYRSHGNILAAANAIIKNNRERLGKNLWTDAGDGEPIRAFEAYSDLDEARFVVDEIRELVRDGVSPTQVAVLYRSNAQSRVLEHELFSKGVPYKVYGGLRFFERQEIKHALAYLRLLGNPDDDTAFLRVVNFPTRGIGARSRSERQPRRGHHLKPQHCDGQFLRTCHGRGFGRLALERYASPQRERQWRQLHLHVCRAGRRGSLHVLVCRPWHHGSLFTSKRLQRRWPGSDVAIQSRGYHPPGDDAAVSRRRRAAGDVEPNRSHLQ